MQRPVKNTADKIRIIRAILNGDVSFDQLRSPEHYISFIENDNCMLYTNTGEIIAGITTRKEFDQWQETSLRDCDTIVTFNHQSSLFENNPTVSNNK